jgi:DHA2 family multidrug resistance protein
MDREPFADPANCNCLAVRQAARYITQFYDQHLAEADLRRRDMAFWPNSNVMARSRSMHLPQAFREFAQQFTVAPIVTLTLGVLLPERLKSASGLFNPMCNPGGAIGIAACGTILNDRTNLHFLRIAEHLTTANIAMQNILTDVTARYSQALGDPLRGQAAAVKQLRLLAYREAQVETFADAYLAIAVCFAVSVVMMPFMHKVTPPRSPSPATH